jgi:hypothetical protein
MEKQHLEMLQLLESIEVMLKNGDSIHPNSVIRAAIQTAIGMEIDVTNVKDKCDNKSVTVVEWFAKELNNWRIKEFGEDSIIGIPSEVFDQAKEMEKEQIINAYNISWKLRDKPYATAEKYYNETFKLE